MATQYAFGKIVTDGLVLCLDAADRNSYVSGSTTWFDLAGSNNGTLTNGPTFDSGSGGNIVFDGVDDFVNCGNNTLFNINQHTIAFWFYPKNTSITELFVKSNNANNGVGPYEVFKTGTKIAYRLNSTSSPSTTVFGNITYSINQWYYVTATYDNTRMKTYINSTLDIDAAFSTVLVTSTGNLAIGAYSNGNFPFTGNIGLVQFYNRALTADEVLQNYNAQKSRFGL